MATREGDHVLRKKLQSFLKDILHVGTLDGFKHFSLYIRGKEELIVTVVNEPVTCGASSLMSACNPISPGSMMSNTAVNKQIAPGGSFSSGSIPYDKASLMLSQTTQMKLSGYGDEGVGLPPASPSEQELTHNDSHTTLFLLACYSRYGCPYVWVRSNHDRLIKLSGDSAGKDKDNPLKLKSTNSWRKQDCHISEILAEVVKLCAYPAPQNPLAIDFNHLNDISGTDRLLASGALMQLLEKVIMLTNENKYYIAHVLEDYRQLTELHMKTLCQIANSGQINTIQRPTDR